MRAVSRAAGHTVARAVGYAIGERLRDPSGRQIPLRLVHDAERVLDHGVEGWSASDLQGLCTACEGAERRCDSALGRTIDTALPDELEHDARVRLVRSFALHLRDQCEQAVVWSVHAPSEAGDARNHHAHFFLSDRAICDGAIAKKKVPAATSRAAGSAAIVAMRVEWAKRCNAALARAGSCVRIDHRSHADAGIPLEPTEHVGACATHFSRAGYAARTAQKNKKILENDTDTLLTIRSACDGASRRVRARRRNRNRGSRRGVAADRSVPLGPRERDQASPADGSVLAGTTAGGLGQPGPAVRGADDGAAWDTDPAADLGAAAARRGAAAAALARIWGASAAPADRAPDISPHPSAGPEPAALAADPPEPEEGMIM